MQQQVDVTQRLTRTTVQSQSPRGKHMRMLTTQKQLKDIAAVQRDRIVQLREEIHRLHLRSYPTFVEQHVMYPDEQLTRG